MKDPNSLTVVLSLFSKLLVAATLALIFIGALVTSRGAGLAVPDWPTTFGYNMFAYPFSKWVSQDALESGVFYEHLHRQFAAIIGLLTTILAIWVCRADSRKWVRWLAVSAFLLVVVQGIFGGLRVTKISLVLAMIHGCVAQAFLCVVIVLAVALGKDWQNQRAWDFSGNGLALIRSLAWFFVGAVYVQLILGAVMRHSGAGLAIPDFPLANGHIIPPIHSFAVGIHFAHRVGALVVSMIALLLIGAAISISPREYRLVIPALAIAALIAFQIALGAHIIWLIRPPVTTTLHVVNGAALLGTALLLALRATRLQFAAPQPDMIRASHSLAA